MSDVITQGKKLRKAIEEGNPLQLVGTINAYTALLAEKAGHKAIYLSGGGVAASSLGVPDLGITTLQDVLIDVERITNASSLPLLVDADTGWGGAFNISRTVKSLISHGAAGMHIEDQVAQKRCGHRPNKEIVSTAEMIDRIKELWKKTKITILFIEHDMDIVFGIAQKIYVLQQGAILAEGRPKDIKKDQKVIKAYLGGGKK